jgi:hypothetical protein
MSAHTACPPVSQKTRHGAAITAQNWGCNVGLRVSQQSGHQIFDKPRRCQRRIALQVHHDIKAGQLLHHLSTAFSAVLRGRGGHHHLGSKRFGMGFYAVIIGGHHHTVHPTHRHRRVPTAANQSFLTIWPAQRHQRLTRIPGRGIAGRNGDEDSHFCKSTPGA